jgi:rhodanese-related sulfurtransferase
MKKIIVLSVIIATAVAGNAQPVIQLVKANQFKEMMDSIPGAVVLDLRTPDELKEGVIPTAINVNYFEMDFISQIEKYDRNGIYLLYCASGGRSGETMTLMEEKGFKRVYNLEGGFSQWKKLKMPIEAYKGQ